MKYTEIDIKDIKKPYLIQKLKKEKKVLLVVQYDLESKLVCSLSSYGCTTEENTWMRVYASPFYPLHENCICSDMTPTYRFNKEGKFIHTDLRCSYNTIYSFMECKQGIKYIFNTSSKEFLCKVYLSNDEGDISNLGASLEPDFIDEYVKENDLIQTLENTDFEQSECLYCCSF